MPGSGSKGCPHTSHEKSRKYRAAQLNPKVGTVQGLETIITGISKALILLCIIYHNTVPTFGFSWAALYFLDFSCEVCGHPLLPDPGMLFY